MKGWPGGERMNEEKNVCNSDGAVYLGIQM